MKAADTDRDGVLTHEEFLVWLKKVIAKGEPVNKAHVRELRTQFALSSRKRRRVKRSRDPKRAKQSMAMSKFRPGNRNNVNVSPHKSVMRGGYGGHTRPMNGGGGGLQPPVGSQREQVNRSPSKDPLLNNNKT